MKTEENFLITIMGLQTVQGKTEKISLSALGTYEFSKDQIIIRFYEYDPEDVLIKTESVIEVDKENKVTITKQGTTNSQLILQKGVRHMCHYITEGGSLQVGTYTNKVSIDLNEKGGVIVAEYEVDINSSVTSSNRVYIKIQEALKNNV